MKTKARSSPSNIKLTVLLAAGLMFGAAQNAMAGGTTAGTSISNTATLNYDVLGVTQTPKTATSTPFVVDEKVNMTVTGGANTNVVPGATAQVSTFSVTNNANSPLDFNLAVNQVAAGDQFDATSCNAYVESGANAGYQSAEDTATFIDELAADASKNVYVVCSIPASQVNTDTALVGLTATARGDFTGTNGVYAATAGTVGAAITATAGADTAGTVDIVFSDVAGTESGDAASDGKHSGRNTYTVVTAALSVSKTASLLCDPTNGVTNPKNIPGAITRWTIVVSNSGSADATLTTVTDTLSATLAHDANLVAPTNAATCDTAAGTAESGANAGFKVTVPVARQLGGSAAGSATTSYFTTNTADGLDIAGQAITATYSTILPVDAVNVHATAGLLKSGESVTIIFNTVMQ
ncbi:MAG: hypothetical protein PHQ60_04310 [Sideroxydans sp.]|nr:hypothetical protein [Sideroxydans sp.]